jgi:hypothetical protein
MMVNFNELDFAGVVSTLYFEIDFCNENIGLAKTSNARTFFAERALMLADIVYNIRKMMILGNDSDVAEVVEVAEVAVAPVEVVEELSYEIPFEVKEMVLVDLGRTARVLIKKFQGAHATAKNKEWAFDYLAEQLIELTQMYKNVYKVGENNES